MQSSTVGIAPGTVVAGQYRVEAAIGEGGYGAVYVATQLNLGRRVALKVLHPDVLTRATALQRFRREAELAQGLAHPNTVRIFDFGEAFGRPYIVYEFLEGRSLESTLVVEGRLTPQRVARIAAQTLKALMEAHGKGIVHRDVKPANLFICNYAGEPDFVKVLDFGIASARGAGANGQALTQEGTTLGTPAYMAPEQALATELDGRADIYSVGLVMAEALAARRVYDGNTAMEILIAQASDRPAPLSPDVLASPLGDVIRVATEKNRDRRYPNARAMLDALERALGASGGAAWGAHVVVTPSGPITAKDASMLASAPTGAAMPATPWPMNAARSNATPGQGSPAWAASPSTQTGHAPGSAPGTHPSAGPPSPYAQPAYAPAAYPASAAPRGSTLSGSYVAGPPQAPSPKRSNTPLVIGIVGIVLLGGAAFGGWALYTYSSALEQARSHASSKDHPTKKAKPPKAPLDDDDDRTADDRHAAPAAAKATPTASLAGFKVHGKTAQQLLDRMSALKWSFEGGSEMDLGFGMQSVYTYEGKDSTATLKMYRTSPGTPSMSFMVPGAKTAREGEWVVELMVISDDGDPLDAPLDELFEG